MTFKYHKSQQQHGFTLIEVMLVMVLIGLIMSAVTFNPFGNRQEDQIDDASARFSGIFNVAAEYGLLNNIELGLIVKKNSYQFVGYDGVNWKEVPNQDMLSTQALPEGMELTLELDDLPIDEQNLLSDSKFFEEKDDFKGDEEEKKILPQVFLLSGGDFTSFKLIFSYNKDFQEEREIAFHVIGLFTLPLSIKGPLYDGEE